MSMMNAQTAKAKPKAPAKASSKAPAKPAAKAAPKPAPKPAANPAKAAAKPAAKAPAKKASVKKAQAKGGREAMLGRVESVRMAQRQDGHFDCFGRAASGYCDQGGCTYHAECLSVSSMILGM